MHAYYVPDTILEPVHAVEKNKTKQSNCVRVAYIVNKETSVKQVITLITI